MGWVVNGAVHGRYRSSSMKIIAEESTALTGRNPLILDGDTYYPNFKLTFLKVE